MTWIIILGLVAIAFFVVQLYNRLIRLRNSSENAWSDIDVQLKRRHDLIPNLVETVEGYASHEKGTFEAVTAARAAATSANGAAESGAAESLLGSALRGLLAVAEAYPELEANENFMELQGELSSLEEAIQNSRRYYNAVVRDLNTACEVFPSNFVAQGFAITKKDYFELEDATERSAPQVSFGE
jgi:LemA protein